ncbi:sugar ABC transporter substrate-binding protein [Mesorhizobium sp. PAMC28654]|uniref:sugar ABC transporter substrate-binding protein n=1 Tax=Mesorhizobium sp. PAMC28654 TaxID=2880934 RepID=UPI001D0B8740|nr:sugar ABC transporter substrate-binding protein [Mesorhizobium sp. PAMC28654]UDL91798.1 sugar ABC transporter substrate-binding protein [Mesorhizobium sp. PAMC28654]
MRKIVQYGMAAALGCTMLSAGYAAAQNVDTQIPLTGEKVEGAPFTVKRDWGTFKLADRIAAKVKAGEKINYVFSYQASGIPLFSPQFAAGFDMGCKMAQSIYPMNCASIAPVQNDPNQQVSQIEAKLAAGEIDCIGIEPVSGDSMTAITNKLMDMGIPVFTSGVPSNGHEFTRFTQIPLQEGKYAAETVLKWIKENNKTDIKVFAVSGGDPTVEWAQGRMKSFVETIKAAIPDATFVTTEANGLNTSYEPGQTYDTYRSFLSANPNVQFIENVDIGAEHADRAIESLGLVGKVFTIGWNSSLGQLDGIEKGIQVAQLDQRWPDQAGFGSVACAAFLKNGEILPNTQTLKAVLKDGVAKAREELNRTMGQ